MEERAVAALSDALRGMPEALSPLSGCASWRRMDQEDQMVVLLLLISQWVMEWLMLSAV
jgi:hypothetical protein